MVPYLVLALLMAIVWLLVAILRKDLRGKMLIMSLAVIPFAFFDYFSQPAYWHPPTFFSIPVGIEGVLFGFSFGGVASALYSFLANKRNGIVKRVVNVRNVLIITMVLVISLGLFFMLGINMMISLLVGLLTGCFLIVTIRPDLTKPLLYSGLYFGLLYLLILSLWLQIFPRAIDWWNLKVYGDVTILRVPLGEVLFGFLFGSFWSVLYEFCFVSKR